MDLKIFSICCLSLTITDPHIVRTPFLSSHINVTTKVGNIFNSDQHWQALALASTQGRSEDEKEKCAPLDYLIQSKMLHLFTSITSFTYYNCSYHVCNNVECLG